MRVSRAVLAIVLHGHLSSATPQILFPINSQVPPVARASVPFSFTFAPSTFSTELQNTYSLSNAPEWLSLDSETRTLSGTPTTEDADLNISITASDDTGSVTMNSELVVRTDPSPTVQVPLISQSKSFGSFSAPSTILYYPSSPFDIQFSPETFADTGDNSTLNYYAVSQNNTPLPSWVSFDSKSLSFSGETPDYYSLVQPPETFSILLVASDVEGFAGISLPFNIEVGNHRLAFSNATIRVQGEGGKPFQYKGLSDTLELDGKVVDPGNLTSVNAQAPSWLDFDKSTFILSGNPPADASSCNVTITAVDSYEDIATALITINFSSSLFAHNITQLNATIGEPFTYDFTSSLLDPSDVTVTAEWETDTPWLSFDSGTNILSGNIPNGTSPSTVRMSLQATSKSSPATQSTSVILNVITGIMPPTSSMTSLMTSVLAASARPSTTSTTQGNSATETSSIIHNSSGGEDGHKKRLTKGEIAAIVVPVVLLVLVILFCILRSCCTRRGRRRDGAKSPVKSDISGPLPVDISSSHVPELGASEQALSRKRQRKNQMAPRDEIFFNEKPHRPSRPSSTVIRKSQTMSNLSGTRSSQLAESYNSGNRGRAFSAPSSHHDSAEWSSTIMTQQSSRRTQDSASRRTQDSAFPSWPSRATSARTTRNFSRKKGSGQLRRDAASSVNIRRGPSTNSKNSSIQQTPEDNYNNGSKHPRRNHSLCHHPGTLVHEDEFETNDRNGLSTSSWLTDVGNIANRESVFSAETQDTAVLFDSNYPLPNKSENRKSIRMVTPSPIQAPPKAHLSTIEASPRTVYKPSRSNGGGGFFLGGSRSSSRIHSNRSPSFVSLRAYSSTDSPALPTSTKFTGTDHLQLPLNSTPIILQHPKPRSPTIQQSSIEKMVSAAGLRSSEDTPTIPQIFRLSGHRQGKSLDDVNPTPQRHSFLGNIGNRLSRTFQFRNSKASTDTDAESQFHAISTNGSPQRSPMRERQQDSRLTPMAYGARNLDQDNGYREVEEESEENSITSEYIRHSLPNAYAETHPNLQTPTILSQIYHDDSPARSDRGIGIAIGTGKSRSGFTKQRFGKGIGLEGGDYESPTLGQDILPAITNSSTSSENLNTPLLPSSKRVPNSPEVQALRERISVLSDLISEEQKQKKFERRDKRGKGLGLGLEGLELGDEGRIVGGRGRRPVSVEVDGGRKKGSRAASRVGFGDDENGRGMGKGVEEESSEGETEVGSAFL